MEWLNFRHLYAFWSVCRYGGFQKASNKVSVSQSAISDQVSQLEDYLEEQLLERTTRSLKVTPAGLDLLKYADDIFAKSSEINQVFLHKTIRYERPIKVGMVGGISRNFIFRQVLQNMNEHDNPSINVIDGSYQELSQLIKSFDIDLMFSLERPQKRDLLKLAFKKVSSSSICIAGKPEIIKKLRASKKSFKELNFFLFNHQFEGDLIVDVIKNRFNLDVTVPVTTEDISLLRFMANSGRGVAFIPEIGIQEDLDSGTLSRIILDEVPGINFYATFLKKGFHQNTVQNFLN